MSKLISERNGNRQFEKMTRWNSLEFSTISRSSTMAQYADPSSSSGARLFITYFVRDNKKYPINKFEKVNPPLLLEDLTRLSLKDDESGYWLEVNEDKDKIRVYREVK